MPRGVRGLCGGYCYHVLNRGNGRQQVFYDEGDYAAFLRLMCDASARQVMRLIAHCLMPNHFLCEASHKITASSGRDDQILVRARLRSNDETDLEMVLAAGVLRIANRSNNGWMLRGGPDTQGRALERVREMLSFDNPAAFSAEVDAQIRAGLPGLVAGNSTLPEGWKRVSSEEASRPGRRERRPARG